MQITPSERIEGVLAYGFWASDEAIFILLYKKTAPYVKYTLKVTCGIAWLSRPLVKCARGSS